MLHMPENNWASDWQKDTNYTKRDTERMIEAATRRSPALLTAFITRQLIVSAGPHTKARPGEGGDRRLHITVRKRGAEAFHIILKKMGGQLFITSIETRAHLEIEALRGRSPDSFTEQLVRCRR
ncbi:hypothetical protein CHELA1G11_12566 [Hyphomicrobiales bacterium]|nr:hypothetical protein CHELA1G2_11741 [Hyphomicrobiales bacterium]CAH1665646.1 hypothetical protein CHELA1G11_12566 [Hyphomicrobiales bacterium]